MIIHHTVPSKFIWMWLKTSHFYEFSIIFLENAWDVHSIPYLSIPILVYLRVITAAGDKNLSHLSLNNSTPFLQSASRASNGLCCSASPGVAANCCSLTKTETYTFASKFGSHANRLMVAATCIPFLNFWWNRGWFIFEFTPLTWFMRP